MPELLHDTESTRMSEQQRIRREKRREYNRKYYLKNRKKVLNIEDSTDRPLTPTKARNNANVLCFPDASRDDLQQSVPKETTKDIHSTSTKDNEWVSLGKELVRPGSIFLLLGIIPISFIMVLQASYFFEQNGESFPIISAITAEIVLVIAAIFLNVFQRGLLRNLIWFGMIIFISIYGLSLSTTYIEKSASSEPLLKNLKAEKIILEDELSTWKKQRDALPESYITKKSKISTNFINPILSKIEKNSAEYNKTLEQSKQSIGSITQGVMRLFLMLINALLAHRLSFNLIKSQDPA